MMKCTLWLLALALTIPTAACRKRQTAEVKADTGSTDANCPKPWWRSLLDNKQTFVLPPLTDALVGPKTPGMETRNLCLGTGGLGPNVAVLVHQTKSNGADIADVAFSFNPTPLGPALLQLQHVTTRRKALASDLGALEIWAASYLIELNLFDVVMKAASIDTKVAVLKQYHDAADGPKTIEQRLAEVRSALPDLAKSAFTAPAKTSKGRGATAICVNPVALDDVENSYGGRLYDHANAPETLKVRAAIIKAGTICGPTNPAASATTPGAALDSKVAELTTALQTDLIDQGVMVQALLSAKDVYTADIEAHEQNP